MAVSAIILLVEAFGGWTLSRTLALTVYAVMLNGLSVEVLARAERQSGLPRTVNRVLAVGLVLTVPIMGALAVKGGGHASGQQRERPTQRRLRLSAA